MGTYLHALGMRVRAATREGEGCQPEPGVTLVSLERLLSSADVVLLHADLRDDNRQFFGRGQFETMKPGAWFINTARGALVDEAALLWSLESGRLAGAALDVLTDPSAGNPAAERLREYARRHDNLIITPHIGGYTFESLASTEIFLSDRLVTLVLRLSAPALES
jgi:D-3-phosphoglycerate dehydrogenase